MKKYFLILMTVAVIERFCFAAEEATSKDPRDYIALLPCEMQKEVLAKITSPKVIQKIALSNKQLGLLIQQMKNKRELTPEVLWGFKDVIRVRVLGINEQAFSVALSPDKELLLLGSTSGVKLWNTATGKVVRTLLYGQTAVSVALSPDKQLAVAALEDRTTRIWDVQTGQNIKTLPSNGPTPLSVALSDDKQIAIIGFSNAKAKIWDLKTSKVIQTLGAPSTYVFVGTFVALSHDKKIALTGYADRATIWSVETGEPLQTLTGNESIGPVALSKDGKIALIGTGKKVTIWDWSTNEVIRPLGGHETDITSIALSPDKQLAVTGSGGKTAKIWNVETGELIQTLMSQEGGVTSVALSPDKQVIATFSYYNAPKIWTIEKSDNFGFGQ